MKLLFLITARGGSKSIPEKNLKLVGGIPLVGRAVRAARRAAKLVGGDSRVVCSTDSPAIADVVQAWGAEVPFARPADLATDSASSIDVVLHALDALDEPFDAIVLVQPTSPLLEAEDIAGAVDLHRKERHPVVSVCRNEHPVEWCFSIDDEGRLVRLLPDWPHQRQAAAPTYRLNGAIYIAPPAVLRSARIFVIKETRGFVMPAHRSIDVDCRLDLTIADAILHTREPRTVEIAGRQIGPGRPCFVIAEAGVNHNGDIALARRLVQAAADAKADAVKFQTFSADRLASTSAPKAKYQLETTDRSESQFDMLRRLELSPQAHRELVDYCHQLDVVFLSSPFDEESADLLEHLGVPAFKVPSGEIVNVPYLRHVARKGKPMIVSTGMATLAEVDVALRTIEESGSPPVALLHCVSNYPAEPSDINLRAMAAMAGAFGVPIGYSDHTNGNEVALAAVALGACVLEKHFTLDRTLPGPDQRASIEPRELATLVQGIRAVESALGDGCKRPAENEASTAAVARKSLVAVRDIPAGTVLTSEMLAAKRPGTGLSPSVIDSIIGRSTRRDVRANAFLAIEDLV